MGGSPTAETLLPSNVDYTSAPCFYPCFGSIVLARGWGGGGDSAGDVLGVGAAS